MENLDKFLRKIEKNYLEKNKREEVDFHLNGEVYKVLLLTREEKLELLFSNAGRLKSLKEIYEWLKPIIYKCFGLKEAAIRAKEEGYIKTYYEVIELVFEPCEIKRIINFILRANKLGTFKTEELDFQKK